MRFRTMTAWAASAVVAGVLGLGSGAPAAALDAPSGPAPVVGVDPTSGVHVAVPLPTLPVTTPIPSGPVAVDGNRDGLRVTLPGTDIGLDPPPVPPIPRPPVPVLPELPVLPVAPAPPASPAAAGAAHSPAPATPSGGSAAVAHPAPGASQLATAPGAVKPTDAVVRMLPTGARGAVAKTAPPGSFSVWSAPLRHFELWLALIGLALILRTVVASAWRDRTRVFSPR